MRYTNQYVKDIFTRWCKVMGVEQAEPLPPITNGRYPKGWTSKKGTYTIPNGIMGYGIARYVNENGAINVIMRVSSRNTFVEMMEFAIKSLELKDKQYDSN